MQPKCITTDLLGRESKRGVGSAFVWLVASKAVDILLLLKFWTKILRVDHHRRPDAAWIHLDPRRPIRLLSAEVWVTASEGAARALDIWVSVTVVADRSADEDVAVLVPVCPSSRFALVAPSARVSAARQAHRQNMPGTLLQRDIRKAPVVLFDDDGEVRPPRGRLHKAIERIGHSESQPRLLDRLFKWWTVPRVITAEALAALLRVQH